MTGFDTLLNRPTLLDRPRQWHARKWFFQVHLWAGVVTAAYVIVASLTGSALVFREEITELVQPSPRVDISRGEKPISPDEAVETMRHAVSGYRLGGFIMPEHPGGAYGGYLLSRGRFVFVQVHPATGEVARIVTRENSFWRFLEDLHNNLLSGRTGRIVNGIGGISLLVLCLTGMVIWWPGRSGWKRSLRINWQARWPRLLWNLHGTVGIWMLGLIVVICFSGLYHVWPQLFRAAVGHFAPVNRRDQPLTFSEARTARPASVSRLIASSEAAVPGHRVHSLQFPPPRDGTIRATMVAGTDPVLTQADVVLLHPVTAQVVRVEGSAERPAGERLLRWLPPLHAGRFAGLCSRIVWFAAGLLMAALAFTGLFLWWSRIIRIRLQRSGRVEHQPYTTVTR